MPRRRTQFQLPAMMLPPPKPQYLEYRQGLLKGIAHYTARRLPAEKQQDYIDQILTNQDIMGMMKSKHEVLEWLDDDDSVLKIALTMGTIFINNMIV